MEDVVSTSSPAAASPSPAKNSTENSPTPLKDPQQEAADQLNASITVAVALVAAAYRVPASVVHKTINVQMGYQYAQENNQDLVVTLKIGYERIVTVTKFLKTVAENLGVEYASIASMTDWVAVCDVAVQSSLDPVDEMMKCYHGMKKQDQLVGTSKPKRSLTEKQQGRLVGSAFRMDPDALKANREEIQKSRESKAREKKVKAARAKGSSVVDKAARKLGDDDDDDDDDEISISDMRV